MIEPYLADDALLADLEAARADSRAAHLWWLGQSGFLIQHASHRLLVDPYLSDALTAKYAGTDKPHVRMSRRVVDPRRLRGIDHVLSSHNHTDHLDAETIVPILENNPEARLLVSAANRAFAIGRVGHADRVDPVDEKWVYPVLGCMCSVVPAAHVRIERDADGSARCIGFLIYTLVGTIYHAGDTMVFDGMADLLRPKRIGVALLPINGKVGNMSGPEAARLAKDIGAGLAVPCHYDMFEFNTASPDAFVAECERIGQPYRVLRLGERFSSDELLPRP